MLSAQSKDSSESSPENIDPYRRQHGSVAGHSNATSMTTVDNNNNNNNNRNLTAVVEKKIRLAQAQSEIDRILLGSDAPLDLEHEMKRVVHVSPPFQPASLLEQELEEKEVALESDLYSAVKQQDFAKAATLKRELNQLHMDDCGAVLQANSLFYRAFSEKNLKDMERLWCMDSTSTCIQPSCKPLIGYKQVCNGWKHMFDAVGGFQRTWMEPHNICVSVKGPSMAVVSCDEHVYLRVFVRGQKRQTELINKLTATNIFRKLDGKWLMVHHHASWHPDSEIAKVALRHRPATSVLAKNALRRKENGSPEEAIGMDGILGMSKNGPLLGSSAKKQQRQGKRIVMESLDDILNGQLGDLLGKGGASDDSDSDDESSGSAIISFQRIDNDDEDDEDVEVDLDELDDEDDDSDDDEDEDEDDSDDDLESAPRAVSIMKVWAKTSGKKSISDKGKSKINNVSGAPKDALRQNCIMALRRLCDQGTISQKQKRLLLTDIISCSAKGEFSLVEVAFELLCGEAGGDMDLAEEEFADQCRVFTLSLPSPESPQTPI